MNYQDLEKHLKAGTHSEILVGLGETFDKLNTYQEDLKNGVYTSGEQVSQLLMECTGLYDILAEAYQVLDTYKTEQEDTNFYQKKMEAEKTEAKINASALEKECSYIVRDYRRLRNIVEAYKSKAEKNIQSCQSYLKYINDTYNSSK